MSSPLHCPFCQQDNQCSVNNPKGCWCFNTNIPQALLDLVPASSQGTVCICAQCVGEFNQDRPGFISKYSGQGEKPTN